MQPNFNYNRFRQLLRFEWQINKKRYGWSALAVFGFTTVVLIMVSMSNEHSDSSFWRNEQIFLFFPLLWGLGSLFTHASFLELSRKESGTSYLLLPASLAEKIAVKWFFTGLLFTVFYIISFAIITRIGLAWFLAHYDPSQDYYYSHNPGEKISALPLWSKQVGWSVAGYWVINGILLLGTVYIRRFVYMKSAMAIFSLAYIIALFLIFSQKVVLRNEKERWDSGIFEARFGRTIPPVNIEEGNGQFVYYNLKIPETIQSFYLVICLVLIPVLLYIVTYKKLAEKEI